jgi:hypothetical protein
MIRAIPARHRVYRRAMAGEFEQKREKFDLLARSLHAPQVTAMLSLILDKPADRR